MIGSKLRLGTGVAAGLVVLGACATVPKGAPQVFHDAEASLQRADDEDVDEIMPTTISKAKSNFESSLSMYKKARAAKDENPNSSDVALNKSQDDAAAARDLARGATEFAGNVRSWDKELTVLGGHYSIPDLLGQINSMHGTTAEDRGLRSPLAKMTGLRFQGPVAYFDTNGSKVSAHYRDDIAEVAKLVKLDSSLRVVVSGYADPRGRRNLNQTLSEARAEAVAKVLFDEGLDAQRVEIKPMGEEAAVYQAGASKLQLERRVDVAVTVGPL